MIRPAPKFIRSDNGPEFIADAIKKWLKEKHVETLYIEPGSPWENGYIESFNGSSTRDGDGDGDTDFDDLAIMAADWLCGTVVLEDPE